MGPPFGKLPIPFPHHIFRDSNMGVGLGSSMGPFRGPMSLGVPGNPTDPWIIFEPNKAFSDIQILMSMMGSLIAVPCRFGWVLVDR